MARTTKKATTTANDTALSSGQVSLVNRFVSKVARDSGLAARSFNSAGLPKTVSGAFALLATVSIGAEHDEPLNTLLASSEGATKRDVLTALGVKKATKTAKPKAKKATAKKAAPKAKVAQKPKAEAGAKRQPVKDLDAAAQRLAKSPEGIRVWWAKAHADQAKAIGLKADGSIIKNGKVAKAMAEIG